MKMMGSVGSFVGPYLIGLTSDASGTFTPAMLLLAVSGVVLVVVVVYSTIIARYVQLGMQQRTHP